MPRTLATALAVALAGATPAIARQGSAELRRYCTADAQTFCDDVDPDSEAMAACFRRHRAELSTKCRRAIEAYQERGGR